MSIADLPGSPAALAEATWAEIQPHYDRLRDYPLDHASVESWLRAWSALEELLTEASNLAYIAFSADTGDGVKRAAQQRFAGEIWPRAEERRAGLSSRLLALAYTGPGLETTLQRFQNRLALFRPINMPPLAEIEELNGRYQQLVGALTVQWDATARTRAQLRPFALSPDRAVRERAFLAQAQPLIAHRDELAALFDQLYARRQAVARNAGFANYRDYAHRDYGRFAYTPVDCARFHAAVEATVVSALRRRIERRRRLLGLETVRPWDIAPDPASRPPLAPFIDSTGLIGTARRDRRADRSTPRRLRPDADRRTAARPREPGGESAGRLQHRLTLAQAPLHLDERRRDGAGRGNPAARTRARLPQLRAIRRAAALLAARSRPGDERVGRDDAGTARRAVSESRRRRLLLPERRAARSRRAVGDDPGAADSVRPARRVPAMALPPTPPGPIQTRATKPGDGSVSGSSRGSTGAASRTSRR